MVNYCPFLAAIIVHVIKIPTHSKHACVVDISSADQQARWTTAVGGEVKIVGAL